MLLIYFFFPSSVCSVFRPRRKLVFFFSLPENFFKGQRNLPLPHPMKSNPKTTKIQPLASSQPFISVTDKNHQKSHKKKTNSGDQQKGPKRSKNQHEKGLEITKKEASSVAFFLHLSIQISSLSRS
jgi:hypothetical protein